MRETALQGFRCGGRPPYGYALERSPRPVAARAKASEAKTRLVPDPDKAAVVTEIFHMWADKGLGCEPDRLTHHLSHAPRRWSPFERAASVVPVAPPSLLRAEPPEGGYFTHKR